MSSFRILFDEAMLRSIQKCTVTEGQAQTGGPTWNETLQELDKFVSLVIASGVIGGSNFKRPSYRNTTLPLMSNYYHVKRAANLFNIWQISQISLA